MADVTVELTIRLQTAARVLAENAGVNMNTWMVGRHPIAHHKQEPKFASGGEQGTEDSKSEVSNSDVSKSEVSKSEASRGSLDFFLKGRIMAGQADIGNNTFGVKAFQWLTKDELKHHLHPKLYMSVQLSMPAQ